MKRTFAAVALSGVLSGFAIGAEPAATQPAGPTTRPADAAGVFWLDQFGPIGTQAQAQGAFEAASRFIQDSGGGILMIPTQAPANWQPINNSQRELRTPEPPAPTQRWKEGPSVTVVDARGAQPVVHTPQSSGMKFKRVLDLVDGDSLPFWGWYPMLSIENIIARGSTSYHDWLQEDVKAGQDVKFYVPTIRGIFPGMFITPNAWSTVSRLCVKSLGYDQEKKLWYFVADTDKDFKKGTILSNKNHVNALSLFTSSHNENQTFDIRLLRHNYSQGDNYLVDARFKYMGDIHSTAGDENGVVYAAFVEALQNPFVGKVDSWNAATGELKFKDFDPNRAKTLGSGRPIINLNPAKCISTGTVMIVGYGATEDETTGVAKPATLNGQAYPSKAEVNRAGISALNRGGLIRLSADAPVTPEVVGRYFAVDEPDEYPKGTKLRRWYLIDGLVVNADGTKDLRIVRHWWGAKSAGSPTLYNPENYSSDGHLKPLKYIIAPGVNAYDVSDGLPDVGNKRLLKLAPAPFTGTPVDFAPGDPIEQAIGPDPFHPISFRSWTWDAIPSVFPAAYFDIGNMGEVQRYTVMSVRGGSGDLERDKAQRYTHTTAFDRYFDFTATANNGLVFNADFTGAAIYFNQPHARAQPIKWRYGVAGGPRKTASLTVAAETGEMKLEANGVSVPAGLTSVGGISGGEKRAANLRGLNVAVKAGVKEVTVTFPAPEPDAEYGVFVECSFLNHHAITRRTPEGFTVEFEAGPAADGRLDWMLVR